MEQEINLDEITDINLLQNLLDQTEDIDDRKAIRGRLAEIRAIERAKRDEKLARLTNTRETMLQEKQKKAAEHKARTLEMYNHMARSGEAGAKRQIDIGILKTGQVTPPSSPSALNKDVDVLKQLAQDAEARKAKILANFQAASKAGSSTSTDPAQEFIRARQEEARAEKERLLKAYDYVSKTGAGPKTVVLEELRRIDIA